MYVSKICAEGIFVTFPWSLKHMKSRSKIVPFSYERHFEIWFPKKKNNYVFWSKLSKLQKKDPILHVTTTFSLKQGETRTSSVPIPHPLMYNSTISLPFPRTREACNIMPLILFTETISKTIWRNGERSMKAKNHTRKPCHHRLLNHSLISRKQLLLDVSGQIR